MKYLKKFNEEIGNPQDIKCDDFYHKYKGIVDFDESEYEQGDEPSKIDLLSEIGDLCNDLEMTKSDVDYVLNNYDCSFDFFNLLKITHDNWVDEDNSNKKSEYLLITHHESGDEIHFTIVDFSLYEKINSVLGEDPMKASHTDINDMLELINKNKVEHLMCQTYVLEDWPFTGYNIVKAINLPELGM